MKGFEKEIEQMHKKEIASLRKEMSENIEPFVDQLRVAGYDNFHDYDRSVMKRLGIGVVIVFSAIAIAFIVWILLSLFSQYEGS